ncbi:MAG: DNA (cytosine-5-)-methyltransferase [Defluviitaleaceae bacterium]|nr:DNA (cytosine-5-)-methyltransferase [Defluviitaleaceae bacterium]
MKTYKFMDFCAGIGGGRLGLELNGMECVAHAELDEKTAYVYSQVYNDHNNYGDITKIDKPNLPDLDILIAGFPCQTFSLAGKRAGFEDDRGLIINHLIEILGCKDVPYFILENVKGLVNHDKGRTLKIILSQLYEAGYNTYYKTLNSIDYGVPQMRERVYIVGAKKGLNFNFKFPKSISHNGLEEYLIDENARELPLDDVTFHKYLNNKYNQGKYDLSLILEQDYLVVDTRQSDLRLYKDKCPTLRTGRHGILYVKNGKLKKISALEALLLQGFPMEVALKATKIGVEENKILSMAGNAMTVSVIEHIGRELVNAINSAKAHDEIGEQLCLQI